MNVTLCFEQQKRIKSYFLRLRDFTQVCVYNISFQFFHGIFAPWREDEEEGWSRGALGLQSGHASSALLCASFSENKVTYRIGLKSIYSASSPTDVKKFSLEAQSKNYFGFDMTFICYRSLEPPWLLRGAARWFPGLWSETWNFGHIQGILVTYIGVWSQTKEFQGGIPYHSGGYLASHAQN